MTPSSVLILGARSDIGRAVARRFARAGASVILAARRSNELAADVSDLAIRHKVKAEAIEFDVTDGDPEAFFEALPTLPDVVVMVVGLLGDQARSETDLEAATAVMAANFTGPVAYLLAAARRLEARGSGCIVGISSVAGDRGRKSNYVYGSAKAGFTAFLSGLRNRLFGQGVAVITVKPGFVATQMTAGLKLPPLLTAQPGEVADAIWTAVEKRKDVIYIRPIWRLIMMAIQNVPEPLFKRLSL
ncbi:short-chain dehydrogenase [Methylobacterium variabile]|jgi:short-subunit dehydrogenase|uniref:Short-chain dehydrogenase n=1 Tax=Methylobacterium variabile TaxID=298794 RepID=A0A0J6T4M8_9HYPH|nr:SDR family oxidoreductase [Methylobacterium variabile]KMO40899.1 short-chain dehydrogenase [Methylobacterium variabile]